MLQRKINLADIIEAEKSAAITNVVKDPHSLPMIESLHDDNNLVALEVTVADEFLQESESESTPESERAIVGSYKTASIQQHFSDTAVNTELTSEDIEKLQEEMKSDKEMLCILSKEVEIIQRKLWMNSTVFARIGKDDKQMHFYTGLPSNVVLKSF